MFLPFFDITAAYKSTVFNLFILFLLKNVDAGAAKELMAHLVNLQSSLPNLNKYAVILVTIKFYLHSLLHHYYLLLHVFFPLSYAFVYSIYCLYHVISSYYSLNALCDISLWL